VLCSLISDFRDSWLTGVIGRVVLAWNIVPQVCVMLMRKYLEHEWVPRTSMLDRLEYSVLTRTPRSSPGLSCLDWRSAMGQSEAALKRYGSIVYMRVK
jgi:hypothetical protein